MECVLLLPQNVNRNQKVSAANGEQFFLVDVIAHILHHLKYQLLRELHDKGNNIKASDIDWVITVPAFWESEGTHMMRDAGYLVSPNSNCKYVISSKNLS